MTEMTDMTGYADAGASPGLVADDIVMRFAGLLALDGVSLEAPVGRVTGLIGPNGAGKTTMFNICGGFQRPTSGRVLFEGGDITSLSATKRARKGIGRTFQRLELFRSLTVVENIELAAECRSLSDGPLAQLGMTRNRAAARRTVRETTERLIDELALTDVAHTVCAQLSTGHGRLVELARTLASDPSLLLLDEPSSGLDSEESVRFGEVLRSVVTDRQIGVLLVEHDMKLVLDLCEWIYVIDFGKPLFEGTAAGVRESELVRKAYLGSVEV